jgi:probable phosphoglycerate mutase
MGAVPATRLVLIRHAEPVAHVTRVVAGPKGCTGLTDLGREQATRLAPRLAHIAPDVVTASVLRRAVETAEVVATSLGWAPPTEDCGLCEVHVGECDGEPVDDVVARNGYPTHDTPLSPGGETIREFGTRVVQAMDRLASDHREQTTVVFTHGGFISAACYWFLRIPWLSGQPFHFDPVYTSITELVREEPDGPWLLHRYNDHAHLEGLGSA